MSAQGIAIALGALSAVAAVVAAILWFRSAIVKTPESFSIHVERADGMMGQPLGGDPLGGKYVGNAYSQDLVVLANALKLQGKRSGLAAVWAGIAAVLQAGALIAQVCATAA